MSQSRKYSLSTQYCVLKSKFPQFTSKLNRDNITIYGSIKPTERSIFYDFKLSYKLYNRPRIKILSPVLTLNSKGDEIPHVYPKNELCLYFPSYNEFDSTKLIADYIVPWISLWLYHYENWHITGDWEGGGIHPSISKNNEKKR